MNKFAVFDIDGTLIRWQLYHVVVNRLAQAGALGESAHHKLKQAIMSWKRREDDDAYKQYETLLIEIYQAALSSLSVKLFDDVVDRTIDEYKDQTYVYTRNLLSDLKKNKYKLLIVSGSHLELIRKIGEYYGFDDWAGTYYERNDQGFTGKATVPSLDKKRALRSLVKKHNLSFHGSIGVGDTQSDISMLELVDKPIAFNPDKFLLASAKKNNWPIVVERKNVIYELRSSNGQYFLT